MIGDEANAYLVLDEELDTLDGGGSGLRDGGGDTTHCKGVSNCSSNAMSCAITKHRVGPPMAAHQDEAR